MTRPMLEGGRVPRPALGGRVPRPALGGRVPRPMLDCSRVPSIGVGAGGAEGAKAPPGLTKRGRIEFNLCTFN